jgi:2-polyprenyl-3-methyl-5-hydroxy-6-metoxy-1,4-benzoquinol methylase
MSQFEMGARQLWSRLPEPVVNSQILTRSIRRAAGVVRRGNTSFRIVRTLEEVDEILDEIDRAAAISDDELHRCFRSFRMEVDRTFPSDPFSDDYRRAVLDLYEGLHGKPYTEMNEHVPFDVLDAVDNPFPYATKSAGTVGDHFIAIGRAMRLLDLPSGSRVLEFGAGWGNLTLAMAQVGIQVTAVDVGQNFVDLITARAARMNVEIEALTGDFSLVRDIEGSYDAVIFFESFHHSADHQRLIADLGRVVAPGGRIIFATEPVAKAFPLPWGLRLDGQSVWAIRKNGWFELGFRNSYFQTLLQREGWKLHSVRAAQTPDVGTFVARRR